MPVVHWTQHAYGSWLPDREQGFFLHNRGYRPSDPKLAHEYRGRQMHTRAWFTPDIQRLLINALLQAAALQAVRVHGVATEDAHFHAVISWRDGRTIKAVCAKPKEALTRRLNAETERRPWFTRGADRRRVRTSGHLDYLLEEYLPDHRGWKHSPERGLYR